MKYDEYCVCSTAYRQVDEGYVKCRDPCKLRQQRGHEEALELARTMEARKRGRWTVTEQTQQRTLNLLIMVAILACAVFIVAIVLDPL